MAKLKTTSVTGDLSTSGASSVGGNLTVTGTISTTGGLNAGQLKTGTVPTDRLPNATTSVKGAVQLSTATNSTSTSLAATASAVKSAYDRAETKLPLAGGTTTGTIHANVNTDTNILTWKGSSTSGMLRKITDQGGALLSSDSNLWLHAGDQATTIVSDAGVMATTTTEDLVLSADSSIKFIANTQSGYASASKFHINSNGWNGNVVGSVNGNASTSSKWANARTITLGGDLSGSVSIDGSANVTLSGQVADDSHNHSSFASKESTTYLRDHGNGNVTLSAGKNGSGTVGDLYIGYNSGTSYVTTNVRLCRPMNWNGSHTIVDSNGKVPWSSLTGVPSSFPPSSHTHDDRYYTESEMNTKLDGKANTSGSYSGLRVGKDIIHDTRGANRAPNYYDRQSVRYDFVEGSQVGYTSNWTTLMTVSPWTSWNASHKQSQIAFSGDNMAFRYATSDTAWSSWYNFIWSSDVTEGATASKIVRRNSSGDVQCRLVRSEYADQSTISGGMVFRVNNSSDNFLRVCNSPSAIRTWLGAQASGSYMSSSPSTINMAKSGTVSKINFASQTNDPGYIEHYESNNTARMRFSVSDDNAVGQDIFEFGSAPGGTFQSRFQIDASGQAKTAAAAAGSWWDIGGARWSTAGPSGSAPKGAIWVQY